MNEMEHQYKIRIIAGLILLTLACVFLYLKSENQTIEYIMIGLAAFVVGGSFFKTKEK